MTVAEFIAAVSAEAAQPPFIHEVLLLDQTDYAAKLHLIIRADLFVQLYANTQSGTRGYTIVYLPGPTHLRARLRRAGVASASGNQPGEA